MDSKTIRVFFRTDLKGRSRKAQETLALIRERLAATADQKYTCGFNLIVTGEHSGRVYVYRVDGEPNMIFFQIHGEGPAELPVELAALKPARVELTATAHFNFPTEGQYEEGGAEVLWKQEIHNDFNYEVPTIMENSWTVSLTVDTVEAAEDLLRRIRLGEAPLRHRWVDRLPAGSTPQETGAPGEFNGPDDDDVDPSQVAVSGFGY